ncbi:MAG: L,D-transpeptidase [Patescibacteria group bacterium]
MTISKTQKKTIAIASSFIVVLAIAATLIYKKPKEKASAPVPVATQPTAQTSGAAPVAAAPIQGEMYHTAAMTTATPAKELAELVGSANVQMVLEINRIDARLIKKGAVLVIPNSFDGAAALSPFPARLEIANDIPKLMLISQAVQAFGIYESGALVRWGGVSSGKQSTQTPSKLYFTNWKGKEVHSSFSDEWILKWNFNLDNKEGIGMHQYEMPGYPASHSCVRMFGVDAEWVYNWADQWVLSDDEQAVVHYGTPVIVFGQYGFGKTAPWKNLPKDAAATTVSVATLEKAIGANKDTIIERQ